MANQINIAVGADIKDLQEGLKLAVSQMEKAGTDMSKVGESVSRLTSNNFKSLSQAYRTTSKDAEILAMHLGTESEAFKQAAAMAQSYGSQLNEVRSKIAGVDLAAGAGGIKQAKTQFDGLGMSINQLTRELPAFTYSVQTGFMALSNNIPMFVDQINNIKRANMELAATGQPVQSVFSQITSSLFSWNTAISLGITALTMFGPAIGDFISVLFGAKDALSEVNEEQKKLNDLAYEYITSNKQKAIDKETESYKKLTDALRENIRLSELSVEQSLIEGKSRFDVITGKRKDQELLETYEKQHRENLKKINEQYDRENITRLKTQSDLEVNIFEDKFTKMRNALADFKAGYSDPMPDLITPTFDGGIFDPNSIVGLEEVGEDITMSFQKITENVKEQTELMKMAIQAAGSALAGAGAMLGESLVTGDFQKAGEGIVKMLGSIAMQIGAAMVSIGIPMVFSAITAPEGLKLIAGGTALGIVGGAMRASGSSQQSSGGYSSGGYSGGGMGGFNPIGSGMNNFSFDGVVRGSNLEIVLLNTNQQNRRIR